MEPTTEPQVMTLHRNMVVAGGVSFIVGALAGYLMLEEVRFARTKLIRAITDALRPPDPWNRQT